MRFLVRWTANSLAFYLAIYLLDSLVAPRFYVGAVWVAIVAAVFLGVLNSLIRPLHRLKDRPARALGVAAATVIVNALVLQAFIWAGAPLSVMGIHWIVVAAVFLAVLAGAINWLIGFKPPKEPNIITRDLRTSRGSRDRGAGAPRAGN